MSVFSDVVETATKEFKTKWLRYLVASIIFATIIGTTGWLLGLTFDWRMIVFIIVGIFANDIAKSLL